jgi:hypothetical protein
VASAVPDIDHENRRHRRSPRRTVARPLLAQQTLILTVCQDGPNGSPHTAEDLGRFPEGTWSMTARSTGFTTGTNAMSVTLRRDAASGHLRMEGGGQCVPLTILTSGTGDISNAPFHRAVDALASGALTTDEAEVLTGCATPLRYFWEMGSGAQRSWGGLMFYGPNAAVGFMANSAGGTRAVTLSR